MFYEFSRKVKRETLSMGSRPIALAVSGRTTPNAVGLLPFSEKSPMRGTFAFSISEKVLAVIG
jgi:hypothetical protein